MMLPTDDSLVSELRFLADVADKENATTPEEKGKLEYRSHVLRKAADAISLSAIEGLSLEQLNSVLKEDYASVREGLAELITVSILCRLTFLHGDNLILAIDRLDTVIVRRRITPSEGVLIGAAQRFQVAPELLAPAYELYRRITDLFGIDVMEKDWREKEEKWKAKNLPTKSN